jgi:hypothetical protein
MANPASGKIRFDSFLSQLRHARVIALWALLLVGGCATVQTDPLPAWNDGKVKQSIVTFVAKVATPGSPDFVPVAERVATFDNDGTLWAEQPLYVQMFFVLDRVRALAPQHPEWKTAEPFASVLKGDIKGALAGGDKSLLELIAATSTGMTTAEFEAMVANGLPRPGIHDSTSLTPQWSTTR